MKRRLFLSLGAAGAATVLSDHLWPQGVGAASAPLRHALFGEEPAVQVRYPGMAEGHRMRDRQVSAADLRPGRQVDVLVVGSGVAGLSCAWGLQQAGHRDFLLLEGPAPLGNAACGNHAYSAYPQGAHYLPVPSTRAMHVRHLLQGLGVLKDGLRDVAPRYDERYLVHPSAERLYRDGQWQHGLVPDDQSEDWKKFVQLVEGLQQRTQGDGPSALEPLFGFARPQQVERSTAAQALDRQTFAQWLDSQGLQDAGLRWYLDYCCRDDYGADASAVSAWAGLNYFCGRGGHARDAEDGAVLTWPQGLGFLATGLRATLAPDQRAQGTAVQVLPAGKGCHVLVADAQGRVSSVAARKVVLATPLFVARRLAPYMFEGLAQHRAPDMNPWLVANLFMRDFPAERPGAELAWDNVVAGSSSLGYVVATHQLIRAARPEHTVFTAYHACGGNDNAGMRRWLAKAGPQELLSLCTQDLETVYGPRWRSLCSGVEITVHGHAMANPSPGFLSDAVAARARGALRQGGPVLFAHADLSGYSVFEDASFWGLQCAEQLLQEQGRWA